MLVLTRRREEAESEESYGSEPYEFWEVVGLDFRMCATHSVPSGWLLGGDLHGWQDRPASTNGGRVRPGPCWSLGALAMGQRRGRGEDGVDDALMRTRRRWTGHPRKSCEARCWPPHLVSHSQARTQEHLYSQALKPASTVCPPLSSGYDSRPPPSQFRFLSPTSYPVLKMLDLDSLPHP